MGCWHEMGESSCQGWGSGSLSLDNQQGPKRSPGHGEEDSQPLQAQCVRWDRVQALGGEGIEQDGNSDWF